MRVFRPNQPRTKTQHEGNSLWTDKTDLTTKWIARIVEPVSNPATPKWVIDRIETFLRRKPWGRIEIKVKAGQVTDVEVTENHKESTAG